MIRVTAEMGSDEMNGRPDLMHLVKAIEREAATLPEAAREDVASRIKAAITTAADSLVAIRDHVAYLANEFQWGDSDE